MNLTHANAVCKEAATLLCAVSLVTVARNPFSLFLKRLAAGIHRQAALDESQRLVAIPELDRTRQCAEVRRVQSQGLVR